MSPQRAFSALLNPSREWICEPVISATNKKINVVKRRNYLHISGVWNTDLCLERKIKLLFGFFTCLILLGVWPDQTRFSARAILGIINDSDVMGAPQGRVSSLACISYKQSNVLKPFNNCILKSLAMSFGMQRKITHNPLGIVPVSSFGKTVSFLYHCLTGIGNTIWPTTAFGAL